MERSPNKSGEARSPWAIKKLSQIQKNNEKIEKRGVFEARLEYEAGVLKLLSHPNIIGYRGHGHAATDNVFLAMETASKSLWGLIEERVIELGTSCPIPFPAKYIEKVALDMAKALQYLHDEKRIIHGDLKSANILICGDFEIVKLCDFGVARKIKEDGTLEEKYVGTEIWNPMEVILDDRGTYIYSSLSM
jgi:PDZ-binding kinase